MERIGVDVGGTFTDIVALDDDQSPTILKILSTPSDYSEAIGRGLAQILRNNHLHPKEVVSVIHAYTVATNAILTGTGAKVGLITTDGFRDVLEIGRLRMPKLYDMEWDKPRPLVPRYLRQEVEERIDYRGNIVRPLDLQRARTTVDKLLSFGIDSIAICLLHSYVNPIHEQQLADLVKSVAPGINLSVSHQVLPEIKEYERTSTTVINAYIQPVVNRYLEQLESRLHDMGISAPLMVMQSSGGIMRARTARERPVHCIESGPAAGAIGAATAGRHLGLSNLIAFDMGGTTAKVCLIEEGEPRVASEMEVGSGINVGQRLLKGGGYPVRAPAIDLAEIGAGGGSIAWIDKGGALRVGPHSAGADPGPACYMRGGTDPAVTDANVVLGFLNSHFFLSGEMAVDGELAARVVRDRIGSPLGLATEEAAFGIHTVVNSNMVRAVQAVSSEIGRDPQEFVLFVFGGSGPVHAASLAVAARIPQVIIPPAPGVFSALGLLFTVVEHRYVHTFWHDFTSADRNEMTRLFRQLEEEGLTTLADEGFARDAMECQYSVDFRYSGQSSELTVQVPSIPITEPLAKQLIQAFHKEHDRTYGYSSPEEPVQFVNLRLRARGRSPHQEVSGLLSHAVLAKGSAKLLPEGERKVYFGMRDGWLLSPVIHRGSLGKVFSPGPLIIEEYDTTIVVPPGATASLDEAGNVRLDVSPLL